MVRMPAPPSVTARALTRRQWVQSLGLVVGALLVKLPSGWDGHTWTPRPVIDRRTTLTHHLAAGHTIREGWPSGFSIDWRLRDHRVETCHSDHPDVWRVSPLDATSPAALAAHLEHRACQFGWSLEAAPAEAPRRGWRCPSCGRWSSS